MKVDENHIIFNLCTLITDSCSKQNIMFDIGAHKGGSARSFLENNWTVYAFEPDINNRSHLEKLKINYPNLNIDVRAVSNEVKSSIPFYKSEVSTGISGLSKFHDSHIESDKVDTVTIKEYCKQNNIDKIDYLKIDTEGFDLFVLKGVPWEKISPDVILCEFEDRKTKPLAYSFYDMADYLVDKGYELIISEWFPIVEYGRQHSWNCFKKYPCKLDTEDAWGNIMAFRDGIEYTRFANAIVHTSNNDKNINDQLNAIYNSTSWEITKPLRFLSNIKRKFSHRLHR